MNTKFVFIECYYATNHTREILEVQLIARMSIRAELARFTKLLTS